MPRPRPHAEDAPPNYATQREEDAALGRPLDDSMTEDPKLRGLPLHLQHQNRRPPTPEVWAEWEARFAPPPAPIKAPPPSTPPAEAPAPARTKPGGQKPPPEPKGRAAPTTAELISGSVIRIGVAAEKNPYRPGSVGHAAFSEYVDGMRASDLEKRLAGKTGKRKPADLLMYDVRKGYIRLEPIKVRQEKILR